MQLGPLLRRHRRQQPRHRRHAPAHLLEQLVERPRVIREEPAVLRHELGEVARLQLAAFALADQLVQVPEHALERSDVLGRHRPHPLRQVAEVRAHHLFSHPLHQLVELPLRLLVDEPVLLQLAELAGRVRRQHVQGLLAHTRAVLQMKGQRAPFVLQDLRQAALDLLEGGVQVQTLALAPGRLTQPGPQGVQAGEPAAHPASQQPRQRALRAGAREDVLGHLVQHLGRRQVRAQRILRPIPA